MNRTKRKMLLKIVRHVEKMRFEMHRHAEETGLRHVPNKRYFKERRKLKKRLLKVSGDVLTEVYAMHLFMRKRRHTSPSEEARRRYEAMKRDIEDFERENAVETLLEAHVLDEDIKMAFYVLYGEVL